MHERHSLLDTDHFEVYERQSLLDTDHFEVYERQSLLDTDHFEVYERQSLLDTDHFEVYERHSLLDNDHFDRHCLQFDLDSYCFALYKRALIRRERETLLYKVQCSGTAVTPTFALSLCEWLERQPRTCESDTRCPLSLFRQWTAKA